MVNFSFRWIQYFILAAIVFFVAVGSTSSFAASYEQGQAFYDAGEYRKAFDSWHPLAESGDMRAQFGLGSLYHLGEGVDQEDKIATRWFKAAAEQGHVGAQYNLGNAYRHGRGVEQNDVEAARWWKMAAVKEMAAAQFNLGMQYYFGRGVPKDDTKAVMWYRRAAQNGHKQARKLFIVRDEGSFQPKDRETIGDLSQTQHKDWLLKQNPKFYTIQLASFKEQSNAVSFIGKSGIKDSVSVFQIKTNDEIRHTVFYGSFGQQIQAKQALHKLPMNLQRASPWIRKISTIQKLVKATPWSS